MTPDQQAVAMLHWESGFITERAKYYARKANAAPVESVEYHVYATTESLLTAISQAMRRIALTHGSN